MSPEYLRQRLRYDPETGKLYWRHYDPHGAGWNTRWAGQEAFTAPTNKGHRQGRLDGQRFLAHQIIWAMSYDIWPEGMIDHRDRDGANNRLGNLRLSDHVRNARNSYRYRTNTSGIPGVRWDDERRKWFAYITVRGVMINLGRFADQSDAVAARKAAETQHGFDPSHGSPRTEGCTS